MLPRPSMRRDRGSSRRSSAQVLVLALVAAASLAGGASAGGNGNGPSGRDAGQSTQPATTAAVQTATADAAPPTAPAGLTVTALGQTSVSLAWRASTDASGVAGYTVYVNGAAQGTTTHPAYDLSGLACGTTYSVTVDAFDAVGNRSTSAGLSVLTAACSTRTSGSTAPATDTSPPTAPTGLTVTAAGQTSLSLAWGGSTAHGGVAGYTVYANDAAQGSTTSTTYTLSGLACGTAYRIAVVASDASGNQSAAATVSVATIACGTQPMHLTASTAPAASGADTTPPTTPGGLTVTAAGPTSLTLAWRASTDAIGVAGYTIYKNGVAQGTTTRLTYDLANLLCGTTYSLAVDAYDAAGNHSVRALISASTTGCNSPSPPPVAATVWVSPSGSDATCARGDASRPCATFNRAYQVAQPGDLVSVDAGSYRAQRIDYDSSKSAVPVTFAPTAGASVSLDRLDVGQADFDVRAAQHVVVRDLDVGFVAVWNGAVDVALQNLTARDFAIVDGDSAWPAPVDVRVVGGNFGPCEAVAQNGACTNLMIGTNIVVDGASIHDVTSNDLVRFHVDGIFVRGCQGCAIRNSTFRGNDVTNIRIQNCCSLPPNQNLVVENNSFGQPNGGRNDGVDVDTGTPGLVIRANVFDPVTGPLFDGSGYSGERLVQNKMRYTAACTPGVTYEGNVVQPFNSTWANVLCGTDVWGSWTL